ncbi:MAG: Flp family type IVb pilin [Desulfobacterales bacterium]|jgi:pilus assembly protein Flp/PilA
MKEKLIKFFKDEDGIETIEYALIAALIAIASIVAATFLGKEVSNVYQNVGDVLSSAQEVPTG